MEVSFQASFYKLNFSPVTLPNFWCNWILTVNATECSNRGVIMRWFELYENNSLWRNWKIFIAVSISLKCSQRDEIRGGKNEPGDKNEKCSSRSTTHRKRTSQHLLCEAVYFIALLIARRRIVNITLLPVSMNLDFHKAAYI